MNILNVGGWYVGNSAILDWMDGFDQVEFIRGDFNVARVNNGIMDIIAESDIELKRKIIKKLQYQCVIGFYRCLRYRFKKVFVEKKIIFNKDHDYTYTFNFTLLIALEKFKKDLNVNKTDEIIYWKKWLSKLTKKKFTEHSVFQNPFFYLETFDGHEGIWQELFSPFKLIFVHRDPYDQLLDVINSGAYLDHSWPRFHGSTADLHPIERFHLIAKKIYQARLRMAKRYSPEQLLIISFEDFVKNHDVVSSRVKFFLEIGDDEPNYSKFFNVKSSEKNIGNGKNDPFLLELINNKTHLLKELEAYRDELKQLPHSVF